MPNDKLLMTPQGYKKLKAAYNKAVADKADQFTFDGKEMLTSYAKYLLEYLKTYFEL